jgi:hypothetical protein
MNGVPACLPAAMMWQGNAVLIPGCTFLPNALQGHEHASELDWRAMWTERLRALKAQQRKKVRATESLWHAIPACSQSRSFCSCSLPKYSELSPLSTVLLCIA